MSHISPFPLRPPEFRATTFAPLGESCFHAPSCCFPPRHKCAGLPLSFHLQEGCLFSIKIRRYIPHTSSLHLPSWALSEHCLCHESQEVACENNAFSVCPQPIFSTDLRLEKDPRIPPPSCSSLSPSQVPALRRLLPSWSPASPKQGLAQSGNPAHQFTPPNLNTGPDATFSNEHSHIKIIEKILDYL